MADVITRFKLETTQYDSKLRDEAKRLAEFTRQCSMAGNEFGKFAQKNVEAARALGSFTPSATNAKDKVKELVGAFNDAAKAYNALTKEQQQSDFGKAMAESIGQLNVKIREAKQELYGMGDAMKKAGSGGLFSGIGDKMSGMLQVFGGNMMTKAATFAMDSVSSFASEIGDAVKQGIELAKQGEGIRIAFERLGRGDILQGLREATHGTVTDLELMKAAVKFNDFKLPLDQLGTMLAFAQQKAKDTGQSVDAMVESIVTGLGRQSLMILDNLGLSAAEIKEKMKETGDMTKAVGEIIREQMAKAGDYVETAADRAAQANTSLLNKMDELGRKFAPVEEASNQLWTSMKIAILDVVGGPLATMLNQLTEAGRLKNVLEGVSGGGNGKQTHNERALGMLRHYSGNKQELYNRQVARYDKLEEQAWREANSLSKRLKSLESKQEDELSDSIAAQISEIRRQLEKARNTAKSWQIINAEYQKGAAAILNPSANTTPFTGGVTTPKGGGKTPPSADEVIPAGSVEAATKKVQKLQKAWRLAADDDSREKINKQIEQAQLTLDVLEGKVNANTLKIDIVDDKALKQLGEMDGWHFDPKTLEIVVESREAWQQLREVEGITFSPKTLPILAPQQLAPGGIEGGVRSQAVGTTPAFDFSKALGDTKAKITAEALAVDQESFNTLLRTAVENGISSMDGQFAMIGEKLAQGLNIPDSAWEALAEEINAKLKELGIKPITLDVKTGELSNEKSSRKGEGRQMQQVVSGLQSVAGGLQQMGIELPKSVQMLQSMISGVMTVVQGVQTIITATEVPAETTNTAALSANTAAVLAMTDMMMVKSMSSIASFGFANGGVVKAARGFTVPGTHFSGDVTPILANAGEVVLNRAQVGNLASILEGGSQSNLHLETRVDAEDLIFVLNNNAKRRGRGTYIKQ